MYPVKEIAMSSITVESVVNVCLTAVPSFSQIFPIFNNNTSFSYLTNLR